MSFSFQQLKQLKQKYQENTRIMAWLLAIERKKLDGCRFNQQVKL